MHLLSPLIPNLNPNLVLNPNPNPRREAAPQPHSITNATCR